MDNGYSLADIGAVTGNEGFCGGSSWVLIILFALIFGFGGGGFGGFGASAATTADVQRAVDLSSIQRGQADLAADIQRGIYEVNASTKDAAYNNLSEIRDVQSAVSTGNANIINNLTALQSNMQNCCCTTQRAIDGVNYNIATESAAIQANNTANTQKILDVLATNRMADMQNQINQLQLQNAVAGVVRYPNSTTYCAGNYAPYYTSGCNCGCGNI